MITHLTTVLLGWLLTMMIGGVAFSSEATPSDAPLVQGATECRIGLNFRDADIRLLITFMSDLTGKTFLVDNAVRGTITLMASTPLNCDEAYAVFLAMLHSRGFTAIAQEGMIKIVPARKAKASPIPFREQGVH